MDAGEEEHVAISQTITVSLEIAMLSCFPIFLQYMNKGKIQKNNELHIAFYMLYVILNVSLIKLMITVL